MAIAHPGKSQREAVALITVRRHNEEDAGTLGSTKISGKEVPTENMIVLFRESDKLRSGEAMKKQNVVSKKRHFHAAIKHQSHIFSGKDSKTTAVEYLKEVRESLG